MLLWGLRACSASPCGRMGGLARKGPHDRGNRVATTPAMRRGATYLLLKRSSQTPGIHGRHVCASPRSSKANVMPARSHIFTRTLHSSDVSRWPMWIAFLHGVLLDETLS